MVLGPRVKPIQDALGRLVAPALISRSHLLLWLGGYHLCLPLGVGGLRFHKIWSSCDGTIARQKASDPVTTWKDLSAS